MALGDMIAFAPVAALALAAAPSDAQEMVPTRGKPASIVATADGRYAFVSETKVDATAPAGGLTPAADEDLAAGIEVFEIGGNGVWRSIGFVALGNAGAYGLRLLPNEKVLAVGAGDRGVMFLRVADLIRGEGAPVVVPQGRHAGVFDIAATPDGRYVFSANEYGRVRGERGNVGVTATGIDADGNVHDPRLIGRIPLGDVVPSLTITRDGKRLLVASEVTRKRTLSTLLGRANPRLFKRDCVQKAGAKPRIGGFIAVVDVDAAIANPSRDAVVRRIASGCSPVRIEESHDGHRIFVTARGDDRIVLFDANQLYAGREEAFVDAVPSGGPAPVGIRISGDDRRLVVANSNRFAGDKGSVATLDPRTGALVGKEGGGLFPRNIADLGRHGLWVTNFGSKTLQRVAPGPAE